MATTQTQPRRQLTELQSWFAALIGGGLVLVIVSFLLSSMQGQQNSLLDVMLLIGIMLLVCGAVAWAIVTRPWDDFDNWSEPLYTGHHDTHAVAHAVATDHVVDHTADPAAAHAPEHTTVTIDSHGVEQVYGDAEEVQNNAELETANATSSTINVTPTTPYAPTVESIVPASAPVMAASAPVITAPASAPVVATSTTSATPVADAVVAAAMTEPLDHPVDHPETPAERSDHDDSAAHTPEPVQGSNQVDDLPPAPLQMTVPTEVEAHAVGVENAATTGDQADVRPAEEQDSSQGHGYAEPADGVNENVMAAAEKIQQQQTSVTFTSPAAETQPLPPTPVEEIPPSRTETMVDNSAPDMASGAPIMDSSVSNDTVGNPASVSSDVTGQTISVTPVLDNLPKDDLLKIEGIGPKIAGALKAAGITTFADLASRASADVEAIVRAAGVRMVGRTETWAQQATLAAEGKWEDLQRLQQSLTSGRNRS